MDIKNKDFEGPLDLLSNSWSLNTRWISMRSPGIEVIEQYLPLSGDSPGYETRGRGIHADGSHHPDQES